jgi:hypothetical protein
MNQVVRAAETEFIHGCSALRLTLTTFRPLVRLADAAPNLAPIGSNPLQETSLPLNTI